MIFRFLRTTKQNCFSRISLEFIIFVPAPELKRRLFFQFHSFITDRFGATTAIQFQYSAGMSLQSPFNNTFTPDDAAGRQIDVRTNPQKGKYLASTHKCFSIFSTLPRICGFALFQFRFSVVLTSEDEWMEGARLLRF